VRRFEFRSLMTLGFFWFFKIKDIRLFKIIVTLSTDNEDESNLIIRASNIFI
jgi:hypothetical protein